MFECLIKTLSDLLDRRMVNRVKLVFNNLVRTAKKTLHFTITKIYFLTLFKEIISVYSENNTKLIIQNADLLTVKAGRTYTYHWALKC
jgi:hypothetical protein